MKDGLGSVTALTGSGGSIIHEYAYSVFGEIIDESGEAVKNPFTYTSREWEPEVGLYFYRARYYDPLIGRFLSEDPIGLNAGDFNLCRYVENNPLNYIDPEGLNKNACGSENCWLNCMKNYPGIQLISLTAASLLNMKIPGVEWTGPGSGSPFTSFSRRLGAKGILQGGASVVRGCIGRVKYLGWGGTVVAGIGAFGAGYFIGASTMCALECSK